MMARIAFVCLVVYVWASIVLFGSIFFETLIIYPNIFHDVPRSLETAMAFMVVSGPGDFFARVGMITLIVGLAALILGWRTKSVRYWILGSVAALATGDFLLSALFFWPRNTIMFTEGTARHSVAFLMQTASEFQTGHWLRLAMSGVTAALAFVALLNFHRHRIIPPAR
jgi:hypothetical protein